MMLLNIAVACCLFVGTTVIHAAGMMLAFQLVQFSVKHYVKETKLSRIVLISSVVILMFLVSVAEVLLWALVYLGLGAIDRLEKALYFSMVTFTTLGYGDIVLAEHWHLLASFEAANGIIMFGWTTSVVIATVTHVYFKDRFQEK